MEYERTVTTREFLRNFRSIKQQLLSGELQLVRIDVGRLHELHVTHPRPAKKFSDFLHAIETLPHPISIRRTHMFDELLKPRKLQKPRRHKSHKL